jgi:hypothetical protein
VLSTPLMVLYALGYKYDFQNNTFLKTGSLIVRSQPQKANIYINDTVQTKRTDSTIRFLSPGDVNVKIEKPGYQSWTKRLNLKSGLVTWANQDRDFITLFYEQPKLVQSKNLTSIAVSVKNQEAVIVENNKINSYNPNRGNISEITNSLQKLELPTTFNNPEDLYYLLKFPASNQLSLEQIKNAKYLESNNDYAAVLLGKTLVVMKNQITQTISQNSSGFTLENDHLWFVEGKVLKHIQLGIGAADPVTVLPFIPQKSRIIRGSSQIFLVLDENLYAMNEKVQEIYRGVNFAYWDKDANKLVIANNNEVLLFDPSTFRTDLIIRSSTAIAQPIINHTTGYLFFINEDKIKAIELDGRDHRNVYTISSGPAKSFLLSKDGKLLTTFTDTELNALEIRE